MMTQLIDKAAVVAEIEERIATYKNVSGADRRTDALISFKDFLDTLEVKEVDLEDKIDEAKDLAMRDIAWKIHCMISEGKAVSMIDHYVCGICDF